MEERHTERQAEEIVDGVVSFGVDNAVTSGNGKQRQQQQRQQVAAAATTTAAVVGSGCGVGDQGFDYMS